MGSGGQVKNHETRSTIGTSISHGFSVTRLEVPPPRAKRPEARSCQDLLEPQTPSNFCVEGIFFDPPVLYV